MKTNRDILKYKIVEYVQEHPGLGANGMNDGLNRTVLERAQVYLDAARKDEKVIADWLTRLEPDRGSTGKLDASIWFLLGFSVGARDVLLTPEAYEPYVTVSRFPSIGKEALPNG